MTKKALRKELEYAYEYNKKLVEENEMIRENNRYLAAKVDFLQGKIDTAINYCERQLNRKNPTPTWLKAIIAEG